jgi:hypothetical protein
MNVLDLSFYALQVAQWYPSLAHTLINQVIMVHEEIDPRTHSHECYHLWLAILEFSSTIHDELLKDQTTVEEVYLEYSLLRVPGRVRQVGT